MSPSERGSRIQTEPSYRPKVTGRLVSLFVLDAGTPEDLPHEPE